MKVNLANKSGLKSTDLLAGSGTITGIAAFIGASCCVLPIILVNIGFGSSIVGNLAFFASAKPIFMAATVAMIAIGFLTAFWGGRRPSHKVTVLLIVATFLAVGAYVLPFYEANILRWLNLR